MRLNEVDGFENANIMMAKFTNSQWIESFLDGNIYMNNFNHFIEQEKRTKEKGQGDSYEAALVTKTQNIKIFDRNSNILLGTASEGTLIERYEGVKYIPIFCMSLFTSKEFEVLYSSDKTIRFRLDIPTNDKENIKQAFKSDNVLFTFSPEVFVQRVKDSLSPINAKTLYGPVEYVDYSIMDEKRIKSYLEMRPDFLFTKHISLKYQREFRFVLPGIKSEGPFIRNIGDLSEMFTVLSIDNFLDNSIFEMNFRD